MSNVTDRVRELVEPLLSDVDASLYDVEHEGGVLRVVLDRDGGIDMSTITEVTRRVSAELDRADAVHGSYTLEVSSPGLERRLRTPEHFSSAVGRDVRIKLRPGVEGDRRIVGRLAATDGTTATVLGDDGTERTIALRDVTRANVHVDWTPPPTPGSPAARAARDDQTTTAGPNDPDTTPSEASS